MKSNLVSTASFFVAILIAVLALAAVVAADLRPFERTTAGLRADIESNRFALPDAVLGLPFEEMREFLIRRTRWQIENDWRLRQRFADRQRKLAGEVFEHFVAGGYYEDEFRRMLRNNVLADFPKLGGYIRARITYTGDEPIEDAVLSVPGARYVRVQVGVSSADEEKRAALGPLNIAAEAAEVHPAENIIAPPPRAVDPGRNVAQNEPARQGGDAAVADDEPLVLEPTQAPLVNEGAAVQSVGDSRINLGRLEKGAVQTVDVWVADLNRDPGWEWTDKVVLTHRDGIGRVAFHQTVSPLLERFDRNPLVMISAATVLLLIAFAIIILWFVGLFAHRRPAAA